MKKTILKLTLIITSFAIVSCGGDSEPAPTPTPNITTEYSGVISENVTWTKDNIYELSGRCCSFRCNFNNEAGTVVKAYPDKRLPLAL